MKRVRRVWAHRTASEYRSASLASEALHWTLQLGLAPGTIRLAHRVVADEFDHAELCYDVLQAAGGSPDAAPVPEPWLTLRQEPDAPLLLRALAVAADEYAVAESVALRLFKEMNRHADAPAVAPVVARIVTDEAHHSRFGWQLVEELLERTGDPGRVWLAERLPTYLERVRCDYDSQASPCTPTEWSWGLMDPDLYRELTDKALANVGKRFRRLGVVPAPDPPALAVPHRRGSRRRRPA